MPKTGQPIRVKLTPGDEWFWCKISFNRKVFQSGGWNYERDMWQPDFDELSPAEGIVGQALIDIEDIGGYLVKRKAIFVEIDTNNQRWRQVIPSILEAITHAFNAPLVVKMDTKYGKLYRPAMPGPAFTQTIEADEVAAYRPSGLSTLQLEEFRTLPTSKWLAYLQKVSKKTNRKGQP